MHYSWGPVVRWRASRSSHVVTWCNLVTISCAGQNIRNGGQDRLSRSPAMPGDICRDNWNISSIHLPLCETGRLPGRVGFRSSFFLSTTRFFFFFFAARKASCCAWWKNDTVSMVRTSRDKGRENDPSSFVPRERNMIEKYDRNM